MNAPSNGSKLPLDETASFSLKKPSKSSQNDTKVKPAAGCAASEDDATLPAMAPPNTQGDMLYSYYDFIETESISHLAPEDFKFLEYKGCFHLPARPLLDELVREYFLHVHPVFPIIDERSFWEAYNPLGPRNSQFKIPLFVFRAMLFVSCSVRHFIISLHIS